ncbi:MAG TPA: DUF4347 domain-containing protein [Ramlibacter sp.]|uniref:DUF4347 domain-containing protein n=1 Tax=Ramlibacter sp. TaxID=1917967 RepID=UPI002D486865|nr:DUF4347 domain-containing protein [Ramlibacter sp.]HZY18581.1 DUF4347 domain-containing protein [Ramlibacter sp.]
MLFDAAGAVAADRQADTSDQRPEAAKADHAPATSEHATDRTHLAEGGQALDAAAAQQGATVVIIDSRVQDAQSLLQGVEPGAIVRIVGEGEDGLQVISDVLASVKNVDSLQIVSHGSAGMLRLGSSVVDNAALEKEGVAATVRAWQQSMTTDGDILLLGCDVAAGVKGQSFVQKLADLSQADVSASVDDTGSSLKGGNWQLEFTVGTTGTKLAFSDLALNSYSDLLADPADRAQTTLSLPTNVMLGSSGTGSVTFDNNGGGNGYAPFVGVAFKSTGTDSVNDGNEGVTYKAGSARYLGLAVKEHVLTFVGGQAVLSGLDNNGAATDIVFTLAEFPGMQNGDQLVIFELPFGSFTPAQTAAQITFGFDVGRNADLTPGLPIVSRGFYRLGQTATNDAGDPVVRGDAAIATLAPRVYTSSYNVVTRESEQVAGPNDKQTISYDVKLASGQGASGFRAEMDIPPNVVLTPADIQLLWEGTPLAGVIYKIVDASTPLGSVTAATPDLLPQANGTYANAKVVAIAPGPEVADGAGSDTFTLSVQYFVARTGPTSANTQGDPNYVIDRTSGGDATGTFDARSEFTWLPADPDGDEGVVTVTDDTLPQRVLQWEAITIQKTVTGTSPNVLDDPATNNDPLLGNPNGVAGAGAGDPDGVRSGETITYRLDFQVSDYHGVRNVVINDFISDGLTFVNGTAKLTFSANGQTLSLSNIDPGNVSVTTLPDGRQQIVIDLSAELAARGIAGGDLLGDAFADAGASGLTRGTITYDALVLDQYRNPANGNSSNPVPWVNENDVFDTDVTISGTLLNNTGSLAAPALVAGGITSDDSGTTTSVKDGNLVLEIYAVNGVLVGELPKDAAGNVLLSPGDNVSYRLRYQTTQADFTQLQLTAFLPDPYFRPADADADGVLDGAGNFTAAATTVSGSSQPGADWAQAGKFALGPAPQNHPGIVTSGITVTTSNPTDGNSIKFSFGDGNDPANPGGAVGTTREVDVIFTVRLTNLPYASSLMTTAQANETSERSPNSGVTTPTPIQDNRLIQVALAAPSLQTSHGVIGKVAGEGGNVTGNTLPGGATVPGVGSNLGPGAAAINGLSAANPITGTGQLDGNVTGLDAGDTLRMAITIVNSGNGEAFKVETGAIGAPAGYTLRGGGSDLSSAGTNFRVMRGDGTVLVENVDWRFSDGTRTAIVMIDRDWTGSGDGGQVDGQLLGAFNPDGSARTDGRNVLVITYDVVANTGVPTQAIAADNGTSTVTVVSYFGSDTSSSDYLPGTDVLSDTATLVVASPLVDIRWQGDATTADRTVTSDDSNQGHTGADNLVIGEMGYFDVKVTVPEGQTSNLFADINLPAGLSLDTSYNGGLGYEIITTTAGVGSNGANLGGQLTGDFNGSGINGTSAANIAGIGGVLGATGVGARVSLGTITNGADGNAANDSFIVRVRVRVDNTSANQQGAQRTATASARFDDLDGPAGNTGTQTVSIADATTANDPRITIVEPTVTTITTVAVVDVDPNTAGDQPGTAVDENGVVEYTITLTNSSGVKAWDLSLLDVFPPELRNDSSLAITSVTSTNAYRNDAAAALGAGDFALDTGTRTLMLAAGNAYDLDSGGTIVVKVRGTANQTAAAVPSFSNAAETRWTSLDRSVANGNNNGAGERGGASNLLNGTNTVNAGAGSSSGTAVSQALTSGGVNNYRTASSAAVQVVALQPTLSRIGGLAETSPNASNNAGGDTAAGSDTTGTPQSVAVGEVVRFRMVTRVPQGVVPSLELAPTLPAGYTFLNDGTSFVALVSDNGMSATGLAGNGVGGRLGDGNAAAFSSIQNNLTSANFSSTDPRAAGSAPVFAITAGGTPTAPVFALGDVTNADNDTDFEYIVIEFNAVVANQSANQAGRTLDTSFTVSSNGAVLGTSNVTRDVVVEPDIRAVSKSVLDLQPSAGGAITPQAGSNVITTQLSFHAESGPNTTTAYDVVLTDSWPSGSGYTLGVLTVGAATYDLSTPGGRAAATAAGVAFSATGTGVSLTIDRLDPGTQVTLRYDATVPTGTAQAPGAATNASLVFSSLPDPAGWGAGTDRFAGSDVGADGTASGERTGAGGLPSNAANPADTTGPLNNYQAVDPAGYGTIAGRLWDDTNTPNGTIDAGEKLLDGVTVTLTWAGADGTFGTADDRVVTTVTDAGGNYSFGALPGDDAATAGVNEGLYRISAPTGVVRTDSGDGADTDTLTNRFDRTDGAIGGLAVGQLTLGDGTSVTTRDFGYVQPNDAPTNQIGGTATFPATPIDVTEDVPFAFTGGHQLSITDPDGGQGDGILSTTLTVTNGTLAINPGAATVTAGASGTVTITLQGTQAQINAALATLTFTATNNYAGPATLTVSTNDRGQGGNAGGDPTLPREGGGIASPDALVDLDIVTLNVVPVSDAPRLTIGTSGGQNTSPPAPGTGGGNNATDTVTGATSGLEDTVIPLGLGVASADPSNPETITQVTVTNVPAGWQLVGGTTVITSTGPGVVYTIPLADVPLLGIRPVADDHGPAAATLTVAATSRDGAGATATTTGTLTVNVVPVNDRPTANDATPASLGTLPEGATASAAQDVGTLFGPKFRDPRDQPEPNGADTMTGVYIVGSLADAAAQGVWQYSIDGGATWVSVNAATASDSAAIYLRSTDLVRFVSTNADFSGTPGQLTVRLVENDQTPAGSIIADVPNGAANNTPIGGATLDTTPGGTSNIAAAVANAAQFATGQVSEPVGLVVQVTPVSDAPRLTIGTGPQEPGNPANTTGQQTSPPSATTGNNSSDTVSGSTRGQEDSPIPLGIGVVSADTSNPETVVSVTVSNVPAGWVLRDAAGVVVPTIGGSTGPLDPVRAAGLTITAPRDLHSMGPVGTSPAATLTITAQSRDGVGSPVATTTGTLRIAVTPVNDRPVVNGPVAPDYDPLLPGNQTNGRTIDSLFGPRYTDPRDTPEVNGTDVFAGVAVIRTPPVSQGSYQFSTDGGATWTTIAPNTTAANAVMLTPSTLLRFAANPTFIGQTQPLQAVLVETDRSGPNADLSGRGGVPDDSPASSPPAAGTIIDLSALEGNESAVLVGPGNSRFSLISAPMQVGVRVDPPQTDQPVVQPYVPLKPLIPASFNPVLVHEPAVYVGNAVQAAQAEAAAQEVALQNAFGSNLGSSGLQPNWLAPEGIPGLEAFVAPLPQVEAKVVDSVPAGEMPRLPSDDGNGCARPRVVAKPRPPGEVRAAPRFKPGSEAARRFSEQLKRARARARC